MIVKVKKLDDKATIPTFGTEYSAGADLYACFPDTIWPGETKKIYTKIAMEIPEGYVGLIYARSGMATRLGLAPANKVGVIDSDYRGEIIIPLYNHSSIDRKINRGDRVAQIIIQPAPSVEYVEVEELDTTDRGTGGFGSTGK